MVNSPDFVGHDRKLVANQPDTVVVDKERNKAVVIDVAVPAESKEIKKSTKRWMENWNCSGKKKWKSTVPTLL